MNSYDYIKEISSEDLIEEIVDDAFSRLHIVKEAMEHAGLDFDSLLGTKNQSEILSRVFEKVAGEKYSKHLGTEVSTPTSDKDPDLLFMEKEFPLEIKVTAGDNWTGGKYSNRPGAYLLISWDKESKNKCFVALTVLQKDDWLQPSGKNYYGTTFSKRLLYEACVRGEAKVLKGSLKKNTKHTGLKLTKDIVREAV